MIREDFNLSTTKIYFHGSLDKNIKKINAPSWKHPFCVTTDIEYAMDYAKTAQQMGRPTTSIERGVVYAMTIDDETIKIFDFQNSKDINRLRGKWPNAMLKAFKSNEYGNSDPLAEITDMILSYEWNEDKAKVNAFRFLQKRVEREFGEKMRRRDFEKNSLLKYEKRFVFRNLLLKDIQELGYDGYRASEQQSASTDNSFVLIRLDNIEKIIPRPIPYEKAEKAVEVLYQRMKSGETIELDKSDYDRYEAVLRKFLAELDTF